MTAREPTVLERFLCWVGRHDWVAWLLDDEEVPSPICRMWACRRCGRIESV